MCLYYSKDLGKRQFNVYEVERSIWIGDVLNKSSYVRMVLNLAGKDSVKYKVCDFTYVHKKLKRRRRHF